MNVILWKFPWLVLLCNEAPVSPAQSEDFSSDEEEEEEEVTVEKSKVSDEKMIRRSRGKKQRSEALVQERVISVSDPSVSC